MTRILTALVLLIAFWPQGALAGGVTGPDGVLRFPFGQRTPPTLRCVPLFVCDVVLEPGETIVNVAVGDSVRWLIAPGSSGPANAATVHVLIKPTEAGLRTNLILTTSRRSYYLTLVSRASDPMLRIGFTYPEDLNTAFASSRATRAASTMPTSVPIDKLDFAYHMSGDRTLQPTHVFNDGAHTYLQMPAANGSLPVIFAVDDDGGNALVNYRFSGPYCVVDGVPQRIALVDGSGRHQRRALVVRG